MYFREEIISSLNICFLNKKDILKDFNNIIYKKFQPLKQEIKNEKQHFIHPPAGVL